MLTPAVLVSIEGNEFNLTFVTNSIVTDTGFNITFTVLEGTYVSPTDDFKSRSYTVITAFRLGNKDVKGYRNAD